MGRSARINQFIEKPLVFCVLSGWERIGHYLRKRGRFESATHWAMLKLDT
jgi:hypothetical protein